MDMKCLDGIGRESWVWGVTGAWASLASLMRGKKSSPKWVNVSGVIGTSHTRGMIIALAVHVKKCYITPADD